MFQFFDQIGSFLGSAVDFVVNLFSQLVNFFRIIGSSFTFLIEVCAKLPVPVQAGCLCIIAVCVIYLVIGR